MKKLGCKRWEAGWRMRVKGGQPARVCGALPRFCGSLAGLRLRALGSLWRTEAVLRLRKPGCKSWIGPKLPRCWGWRQHASAIDGNILPNRPSSTVRAV